VIVCRVQDVLSKGRWRRRRLGEWRKHSGCHG
jgi:hypothetical protein